MSEHKNDWTSSSDVDSWPDYFWISRGHVGGSDSDKFRQLIRRGSTWFDVVIVGIQVISLFLAGEASQAMGSLKLLRVLRIVRILRSSLWNTLFW
jgi:hypothetical protein